MENEIWKPITQIKKNNEIFIFEGYEVSNLGRVRTYKPKYGKVSKSSSLSGLNRPLKKNPTLITGRTDKQGYMQLCLSDINKKRHNIRIHVVVMQTFIGFPEEGLMVCHFNDIKTDNRLENLRYDTSKRNHQDRIRNAKLKIYSENLKPQHK
jgi:hypothetical protein